MAGKQLALAATLCVTLSTSASAWAACKIEPQADCAGAIMSDADLRRANFSGANMRSTVMFNANLVDVILSGASLIGANAREATLNDANLIGADLRSFDASYSSLIRLSDPRVYTVRT